MAFVSTACNKAGSGTPAKRAAHVHAFPRRHRPWLRLRPHCPSAAPAQMLHGSPSVGQRLALGDLRLAGHLRRHGGRGDPWEGGGFENGTFNERRGGGWVAGFCNARRLCTCWRRWHHDALPAGWVQVGVMPDDQRPGCANHRARVCVWGVWGAGGGVGLGRAAAPPTPLCLVPPRTSDSRCWRLTVAMPNARLPSMQRRTISRYRGSKMLSAMRSPGRVGGGGGRCQG